LFKTIVRKKKNGIKFFAVDFFYSLEIFFFYEKMDEFLMGFFAKNQ